MPSSILSLALSFADHSSTPGYRGSDRLSCHPHPFLAHFPLSPLIPRAIPFAAVPPSSLQPRSLLVPALPSGRLSFSQVGPYDGRPRYRSFHLFLTPYSPLARRQRQRQQRAGSRAIPLPAMPAFRLLVSH